MTDRAPSPWEDQRGLTLRPVRRSLAGAEGGMVTIPGHENGLPVTASGNPSSQRWPG